MEKIIEYDKIRYFAYTNADLISGDVKKIVLTFNGLGFQKMQHGHKSNAQEDADNGIIEIEPYYNPWCWMNKQTIDYVDELVDVVKAHFNLGDEVKIIASGGSMGGMCALVYTYYSKHKPARCVTNCPVCDMPYHFTERKDLPRTLYSAYGNCDCSLNEALMQHSPYHLAETMPDIEYVIFHCTADHDVDFEKHGSKFATKMKECGKNMTFIPVPDRGHCDLPEEYAKQYNEIIRKDF